MVSGRKPLGTSGDIEGNPGNYDILSWELEPGGDVAFHMLTLHSGAGSRAQRRDFSVRLIGDDIRHAPREWKPLPSFRDFQINCLQE